MELQLKLYQYCCELAGGEMTRWFDHFFFFLSCACGRKSEFPLIQFLPFSPCRADGGKPTVLLPPPLVLKFRECAVVEGCCCYVGWWWFSPFCGRRANTMTLVVNLGHNSPQTVFEKYPKSLIFGKFFWALVNSLRFLQFNKYHQKSARIFKRQIRIIKGKSIGS